jgi:hypothetical protein
MTTPTHSKKTEQEEATHKQGVKDPKTASPATQRPHTTQHGGPTSGAKVAVAKAGKPQSELAKNKPAVARPVQEGQKKPQVTAAKSVPAKEDLAKKKPVFARLLNEKQRESGEILQKTAQIFQSRQETAHQKRLRVAQDKSIAAMWKQDDRDVYKSQSTLRPKWNEDDVQVNIPWLREKDKVVKKKVPKINIGMERTNYDSLPLPPPEKHHPAKISMTRDLSEHRQKKARRVNERLRR